jgi:hypothetical protein
MSTALWQANWCTAGRLRWFTGRFNRYRLTIEGLPAARYRMLARVEGEPSEVEVGRIMAAQLERGLDLTSLEHFPTLVTARAVRARVVKRREAVDGEWRRRIDRDASYEPEAASPGYRVDDPEMAEIRRLCRPRDIHVQLVPGE